MTGTQCIGGLFDPAPGALAAGGIVVVEDGLQLPQQSRNR
jgi:hypothetical protein